MHSCHNHVTLFSRLELEKSPSRVDWDNEILNSVLRSLDSHTVERHQCNLEDYVLRYRWQLV